jgi:hypothetical protein
MEGKRVRLIRMEDPYTKLKPGDEGVIIGLDGLGDLMVDWDNGAKLKLIPEVDEYEILESRSFIKKFFEFKHNNSFIDSKLEEFEDLIKSFTDGRNLFYEWENRDDHEVIINFELDGDFYRYELDIDDLILTKVVGDEVIFSEEVIDLDEGLDIIEKDIHDILGVSESKKGRPKSGRTKSGRKVPGKYLTKNRKLMKKEIEEFQGKDTYKKDWDADYKSGKGGKGKRHQTKKSAATKAYQRMYGKK